MVHFHVGRWTEMSPLENIVDRGRSGVTFRSIALHGGHHFYNALRFQQGVFELQQDIKYFCESVYEDKWDEGQL
jgi:hypothetical protein